MKPIKRYSLLFLSLALVMMIMSACGMGSTATPNSLTPLQVVQKSIGAMKNLKTSHIDLNATFQVDGANGISPQIPSNIAGTLKGAGDQSISDKQQKLDLTLTLPNLSTQISDVITGDKVYLKTAQGQWHVLDQSASSFASNLLTGTTIDQNKLLALIEHVNITDHGTENVSGQSLRHITANMDKAALEQFASDNPQLKIAQYLDAVKNFSASADVYIDENQFYIHRTKLKVNLGTDENSKKISANIDLTIDLSKFNQPVTITAPANATPLTSPKQLLNGVTGL